MTAPDKGSHAAGPGAIALGADDAGFELKSRIAQFLIELGYDVADYGVHDRTPALYPDIALEVAQAVAAGLHRRAILICGTGIGMAITANKVPGVRAAVCHDQYSAERSRKSNDCQVMALGSRIVAPELAMLLVQTWLASEFAGGWSIPKVARIAEIEQRGRAES
jgi:ribose 5-phosphate isomerase B